MFIFCLTMLHRSHLCIAALPSAQWYAIQVQGVMRRATMGLDVGQAAKWSRHKPTRLATVPEMRCSRHHAYSSRSPGTASRCLSTLGTCSRRSQSSLLPPPPSLSYCSSSNSSQVLPNAQCRPRNACRCIAVRHLDQTVFALWG